jgi:hypothetical protein
LNFKVAKFNSGGKHALLSHAEGDAHKANADGVKSRLRGQRMMVVTRVGDDENNGLEGGMEGPGETGAAVGPVQLQALDAPATLQRNPFNFNDQVNKAEIRWALKTVESAYSYR